MTAPLKRLIESRYGGRGLPVALVLPDGGRIALSPTPEIDLIVRSWRGVKALAAPALGTLARAYVHQDIDFTGSAKRALAGAESMAGSIAEGGHSLGAGIRGIWHRRRGNRANLKQHSDVSNALYRLRRDARMVCSCAYFHGESDTLEDAQEHKLDHICRKLRLAPGETLLDIGCGWGGLIFWAAQHYGVEATGITLSANQRDFVGAGVAARGLQNRVRVELRDYLDLPDDVQYDKVASVGMFEHVGIRNFGRYFGKIHQILKPGGFVLNHGITHNWLDGTHLGSGIGDFVEEYVFPGGELTHVSRVIEDLSDCGLEVVDAEALREHYAKTLWNWVERLEHNADAARAEVGEEKFRVWRIYMAGSAHAFDRGWLSLWQVLAGKPLSDGRLPHPLTREDMYSR